MNARRRAGLLGLAFAWVAAGALALAYVPRAATPAPSAVTEPAPVRRHVASPLELALVDRLFPPTGVVGLPAEMYSPPQDTGPLIAWLMEAEAELARAGDPGLSELAQWIGNGLSRPASLRARWAAGLLAGEELARGWQQAAQRALWPVRLAASVRSVLLAGDRPAPLELAVCDGQGRLAARVELAILTREVIQGWTRFEVVSDRVLLYAPRRNRAVRLWILAGDAGTRGAVGQVGLDRPAGVGGTCELWDAANRERRGVADLDWRWVDPE